MKKILLVEDDKYLVEIYSQELKNAGYKVETVFNGEEALKKLRKKSYDLVILDIIMPKLDGFQVLNKINEMKEKKGALKSLKVVVLSNLSQREEIEKSLKLGATRFFLKTYFNVQEVVEEIKKILK